MALIYYDFYSREYHILGRTNFDDFDDHFKVKASRQLRLVVCAVNREHY